MLSEVELAYVDVAHPVPRYGPLLQERSRINVAAHACILDPGGRLVHFLLIKLAYRPATVQCRERPGSRVSLSLSLYLSISLSLREFNDPVLLPPPPSSSSSVDAANSQESRIGHDRCSH